MKEPSAAVRRCEEFDDEAILEPAAHGPSIQDCFAIRWLATTCGTSQSKIASPRRGVGTRNDVPHHDAIEGNIQQKI
jgi:hypothetical protein